MNVSDCSHSENCLIRLKWGVIIERVITFLQYSLIIHTMISLQKLPFKCHLEASRRNPRFVTAATHATQPQTNPPRISQERLIHFASNFQEFLSHHYRLGLDRRHSKIPNTWKIPLWPPPSFARVPCSFSWPIQPSPNPQLQLITIQLESVTDNIASQVQLEPQTAIVQSHQPRALSLLPYSVCLTTSFIFGRTF